MLYVSSVFFSFKRNKTFFKFSTIIDIWYIILREINTKYQMRIITNMLASNFAIKKFVHFKKWLFFVVVVVVGDVFACFILRMFSRVPKYQFTFRSKYFAVTLSTHMKKKLLCAWQFLIVSVMIFYKTLISLRWSQQIRSFYRF